jgi:Tol biopolymer transport system component/DNA-binding winged helix-turn-helix (wHTH) protein
MNEPTKYFYDFGPFRLDPAEHLLLRDGQVVPLPPKVFDTLLVLVENSGHVMDKDELLRRIWPDTFVEEVSLAKNVFVLRKALGGEQSPQYIETIPKRGYRFVAMVREIPTSESPAATEIHYLLQPDQSVVPASAPTIPVPAPERNDRGLRGTFLLTSGALIGVAVWAMWWIALRSSPTLPPPLVVPFTSFPGNEMQPSFSPDGNQIAFVWDGEKGGNADIYVKQLGNESLHRLTTDPAVDFWPCWSPDGRYIAFTRELAEGSALYLIPSLGGTERRIAQVWSSNSLFHHLISWSPDSEWLVVVDKSIPSEPTSIYMVARETGEKRKLTAPPAAIYGDRSPTISPDGKTVAFVRTIGSGVNDLYLVPTAGGEARRLTFDNTASPSPVWTPDSREILFLSTRGGEYNLWRVPATGGTPTPVEAAGRDLRNLAVSRQGNRLAWTQPIYDRNIWGIELADAASPSGGKRLPLSLKLAKLLISSTRSDTNPDFSPDGQRIAFLSDRSGSSEIWVADSTGERPSQLTDFNRKALAGNPRWSPDGRQIVLEAHPAGGSDIYVINAEGGQPRCLTSDPAEDTVPRWSRDGSWIYFSSMRSGSHQIWRMPAAGGEAIQVTSQGGLDCMESPDGQFLYYVKAFNAPGIWRRPVAGGEETFVLDHHGAGLWRYWVVVEQGIYFATAERPEQPLIELFSFITGQVTTVVVLEKGLDRGMSGLAVSPDGHRLIWSQVDQDSSDIMLMENFH